MIKILRVIKAFGIKGAIKVDLFSENLSNYDVIYDDKGNCYSFSFLKASKGENVITLEGVLNRTDAEKLKGQFFYIKKADRAALRDNEFYIEDLIGTKIKIENSQKNYAIKAVHNFGASDILEIACENHSFLVPFTKENFSENDEGILVGKKEILDLYDV